MDVHMFSLHMEPLGTDTCFVTAMAAVLMQMEGMEYGAAVQETLLLLAEAVEEAHGLGDTVDVPYEGHEAQGVTVQFALAKAIMTARLGEAVGRGEVALVLSDQLCLRSMALPAEVGARLREGRRVMLVCLLGAAKGVTGHYVAVHVDATDLERSTPRKCITVVDDAGAEYDSVC
jgi:hypothetical protein